MEHLQGTPSQKLQVKLTFLSKMNFSTDFITDFPKIRIFQ